MKPPTNNQQELIDQLKARIKKLEADNKELDRLLEAWRGLP